MADPKYGQEPPKNDDGSYKDVLGQFGFWYVHSDGHTIENLAKGKKYDLENIGGGSSSDPRVKFSPSGQVGTGNAATVRTVEVADGETYSIYEAGLLLADGQPAPTDLDLVIATMDNAGAATRQTIVVDGDGTKQNDLSGSPLASYTNSSGGKQTVAVMVDNGQFNAGSGSSQEISAHFDEEISA